MNVLLDSCISGTLRAPLEKAGHHVEWIGDWPSDPGDDQILTYAHDARLILVTLDKDFGALAIRDGKPHAGIIRLVNLSLRDQISACQQVLQRYGSELANGALITVEQNRLRIRRPE
jgi:predicted nuclease of predicted toxin-antitoxin system